MDKDWLAPIGRAYRCLFCGKSSLAKLLDKLLKEAEARKAYWIIPTIIGDELKRRTKAKFTQHQLNLHLYRHELERWRKLRGRK